ncbi:hypothetical protein HYE21_02360 [Mycoplasmopsis bovis]|nr:hypothetical protein [Mycoplasmopsis bovis]QQH24378.1 hypothetical protein HYE21_02360 [Mycoplasmopsis bovis]
MTLVVLVILLQILTPQTQDNFINHQEDNIKEKEQSHDPNGSGNSSSRY